MITATFHQSRQLLILYCLLNCLFCFWSCVSAQRYFELMSSAVPDRRKDDFYAPRDRYSYVASLQSPSTGSHICVATLIEREWVLTHARCVDTRRFTTGVRNPVVALGSESIVGPFKERHLIERISVHPSYNGRPGPYDIALLKLAVPSKLRPLVILHDGSPPLIDELEVRAMSWSRLETGGPYSKRLLEINGLKIINDEKCNDAYDYPANISCLHVSNGDICAGGVGGPIIIPSFPDRLIGIATASHVCNGPSKTTGFLSIRHTREWILNCTAHHSFLDTYNY